MHNLNALPSTLGRPLACAVAFGGGGVHRKTFIVRSSLAVAKYLFAGSNVMPLT